MGQKYEDSTLSRLTLADASGSGGLIGERRAQAAEECAAWESWNLSAYLASRGGTE